MYTVREEFGYLIVGKEDSLSVFYCTLVQARLLDKLRTKMI